MLAEAARDICRVRYFRYLLTSGVSLGADLAAFALLLQLRLAAVVASIAAYALGIGVHWLMSSRLVFAQELASDFSKRNRQKLLFVASALAGLAITAAVIGWGVHWEWNPSLCKLLAVGISFQTTYFLRRTIVFR
jgi:putative flippase GtrA